MQPSHSTNPALFLDIDGVLHPAETQGEPFSRLTLLEAWLRTKAAVDVVVTSSWRLKYQLDTLRQLFAHDLQAQVIGVTPDLGIWGPCHRDGPGTGKTHLVTALGIEAIQ